MLDTRQEPLKPSLLISDSKLYAFLLKQESSCHGWFSSWRDTENGHVKKSV